MGIGVHAAGLAVQPAGPQAEMEQPLRVLVVDDSQMQRRILSAQIARAGYRVLEASSAEEALRLCAVDEPEFILSDWLMGGMSGVEFCRVFRTLRRDSYGYFILLTSNAEKNDVAHGLESGADDFLAKPVNGTELRARLSAGRRILTMERELREKNRLLSHALGEIRSLYDTLDRDLNEACLLQQSLIPERHRSFGSAQVSLTLRPTGRVGGDLVGFFPINARRVALYGIDVAGHGIASALMAARISAYLSGASPEQNIALIQTDLGIYDALPPAELASALNRLLLGEMAADSYLTMIYADVDLITGAVALVQAGHPSPMILRRDGVCEAFGQGGMPIGLLPDARWTPVHARLAPGDKLLLGSDGVTEAADPDGRLLGEDGLARIMVGAKAMRGQAFLDRIVAEVEAFRRGRAEDDVSAVLFEFDGPKRNAD